MAGGQSKGRRKVEIKRIEDEPARQVTFSRRRNGVFKKASELSIMCGAQIAVIVFSRAGKAFSFGHPMVESVIDRVHALDPASDEGESIVDSHRAARIQQLSQQLTEFSNLWEMGKKHAENLMKLTKETEQMLIGKSIGNLNLHELESLQASMETVKQKVNKRAMELNVNDSPPALFLDQNGVRMDFPYHPYTAKMPPYGFGSHMERGQF